MIGMEQNEYELIKYMLKVVFYGLILIGVLWGVSDPSQLLGVVP